VQNRAIEIHDSVFDGLSIEHGLATLSFSTVYIHSSDGKPGQDAGSGWTQRANLLISAPVIRGSFSDLPRDLDDGFIKIGGETFDNHIPIPLDHKGSVELQIEPQGEVLLIRGTQIKLELLGAATYLEEFEP